MGTSYKREKNGKAATWAKASREKGLDPARGNEKKTPNRHGGPGRAIQLQRKSVESTQQVEGLRFKTIKRVSSNAHWILRWMTLLVKKQGAKGGSGEEKKIKSSGSIIKESS